MKKRLTIIAAVIAVAALGAAPLVYAHGAFRHGHGFTGEGGAALGFFGHLQGLKDELDLSDQQTDQLKAIFAEVREQNAPYRDQLHGGIQSVAQTLLKNPNDVAAAQALIDQQTTAERAVKTNVLNGVSKALNVLTPEQRDKLAAKLAEHSKRWEERRRDF
jgi:Spy/CpxP family protein refolding chaperone